MKNKLENELFNKVKSLNDLRKEFSLEEALLIVSGVDSPRELGNYKKKIGKLSSLYQNYNQGESETEKAESLVNFILEGKSEIYLEGKHCDDFSVRRLDRVIDRTLLRKNNLLGNCVGLTNLGAVLGLRENLNLNCLVFPDHVALALKNKRKQINLDLASIEEEFDTKYFKKEKVGMQKKRIEYLLPVLIQEKGNSKKLFGQFEDSEKYYKKAFELGKDIEFIVSLGAINIDLKNFNKSKEYNLMGIKSSKNDPLPYKNNSTILLSNGKYKESLKNINLAINLDPKNTNYYLDRADLNFRIGYHKKSLNDYKTVLSLKDEKFKEKDLEFVKKRIKKLNRKLNN